MTPMIMGMPLLLDPLLPKLRFPTSSRWSRQGRRVVNRSCRQACRRTDRLGAPSRQKRLVERASATWAAIPGWCGRREAQPSAHIEERLAVSSAECLQC